MTALRIILCGVLILTLQPALANGSTSSSPSDRPYYKSSSSSKMTNYKLQSNHGALVVTLYPGSLKDNIIRIAHNCGWNTVIWNVPEDYIWVGRTQVVAPDLYKALFKILIKYPLQAQLYQGNRVLAIVPRNLP